MLNLYTNPVRHLSATEAGSTAMFCLFLKSNYFYNAIFLSFTILEFLTKIVLIELENKERNHVY